MKDVWIYITLSEPNSLKLRILVGVLFGQANILALNFKTNLIISSFAQCETKSESSLGGGKYWKKIYIMSSDFFFSILKSDWTYASTPSTRNC